MSRSIDQEIKLVRNSDAERLHFPVPPGVVGYDPQYRSSTPYSVKAANLLLDRYHYKKMLLVGVHNQTASRSWSNIKRAMTVLANKVLNFGRKTSIAYIFAWCISQCFSDLLRSQNNVRECLVLLHGSLIIQMGIILCRILWPKYSYD